MIDPRGADRPFAQRAQCEAALFSFLPSRSSQRRVRRSIKQATKLVSQSVKAAVRTSERVVAQAEKSTLRTAKRTMRDAEKTATALTRAASRPKTARAETHAASGQFVVVDGLRVHVIVRGRGRSVVLVHGNGTMAEDFAICGLIDRLAERYQVIAIDRPGFGYTARPRHRVWTASAQAALLHRVLTQLKVEKPLLVGHSWGTLVSLALALETRCAPRGLVLLAGFYFAGHRADVTLSGPLAVPGLGDAARAMVPAAVNRALAEQSFRRIFWPQTVPTRFAARFPIEIAVGPTQLRAVSEDAASMNAAAARLQTRYSGLSVPVAILAGEADAIVSASEQSVRLHTAIPGSTLRLLPGQGHMLHYGARAKVERAIDALMG